VVIAISVIAGIRAWRIDRRAKADAAGSRSEQPLTDAA
jgi:hypothetical protein